MSMIDEIKTALSDPSCESVLVGIKGTGSTMVSSTVILDLRDFWDTEVSAERGHLEIIDYTVNHAIYPDIDVGDKVSTPDGVGLVHQKSFDKFVVIIKGDILTFNIHKLVLLAKGGTR